MKDVFLKSDSKESLLQDLGALCNDFIAQTEGGSKDFASGHGFAICYCGILAKPGTGTFDEDGNVVTPVEFYDGVHCNVRVWGKYENAFDGLEELSVNTKIIHPETPCIIFG